MTAIKRKYIILLYFMLMAVASIGQVPSFWQLTEDDGLPSNTVYRIIEDDFGYLWFATVNGLVRYDGLNVEHFAHPDQSDNEIIYLYKAQNGILWYLNMSNELFLIHNGKVKKALEEKKGSIYPSFCSVQDTLYIVSTGLIDSNHVHKITFNTETVTVSSTLIKSVSSAYNQIQLLNSKPFLFPRTSARFDNIRCKIEPLYKGSDNTITIPVQNHFYKYSTRFKTFSENKIFTFSQQEYLISELSGNELRTIKKLVPPNNINSISQTAAEIYIAKRGEIEIIDKINLKSKILEIPNVNCLSSQLTSEKVLFVGTENKGVLVIPNLSMKLINPLPIGQSNPTIQELEISLKEQCVYFGTDQESIFVIDSSHNITSIGTFKGCGKIYDIEIGEEKTYFATDFMIFSSSQKSNEIEYIDTDIASAKKYIEGDNYNWLVTSLNVSRIARRDWNQIKDLKIDLDSIFFLNDRKGIYPWRLSYISKDSEKEIKLPPRMLGIDFDDSLYWVGGVHGLYYGQIDNQIPAKKFGAFKNIKEISTVKNDVFVATEQLGLLHIRNLEVIDTIQSAIGFPNNSVNDLFNDSNEALLIATNKGLYKLDLHNNFISHIDKSDGLQSNRVISVAADKSSVWIGTSKGLHILEKTAIDSVNNTPPPIYISTVKINDRDTGILKSYHTSYDLNNFEFRFTGLNYRSQGNTAYKYRLHGQDPDWIVTKTNVVRYSNLSPGIYSFQVRAVNEDGLESSKEAVALINISFPWWQTNGFRIIMFSGIGFLLYFLFRSRINRIKEKSRIDKQINELRMQAIQTQMNPHFIFNSLNAIQMFLTTNNQEKAMIFLAKFASLIRTIFEHSKQKEITLEEEINFLENYIDLENLRFKDKITTHIQIDKEIKDSKEDFMLPPLLIQPIVENSYKHGLFHKKERGVLSIEFKLKSNRLMCIVEDDGIGREAAEKINRWRRKNHHSSGIQSAIERLKILHQNNGSFLLQESFFVMTDKRDAQGIPVGTKTEIVF